jgi:hypothetical protein
MDMGNPPGIASSVRGMISWAMDIRKAELHNATVQATYVRHFQASPLGGSSKHAWLPYDGLTFLQLLKTVALNLARFRLCGHNLRIQTGRHEGLPRNERSCRRCKRL